MSDPISFTSASPRFGLPLLFAGQAQKEFFVNQAHALTDSLLHPVIVGQNTAPPPAPTPGEAWLVRPGGTDAWLGHDNSLANWQSETWIFAVPNDGMRVFNRRDGQFLLFQDGDWHAAARRLSQREARP